MLLHTPNMQSGRLLLLWMLYMLWRDKHAHCADLQVNSASKKRAVFRKKNWLKKAGREKKIRSPKSPIRLGGSAISFIRWARLFFLWDKATRATVRSEEFHVNENFQWQQLGSNQRPSDLYHSTLNTVPPRSPEVYSTLSYTIFY